MDIIVLEFEIKKKEKFKILNIYGQLFNFKWNH